MADIRDSKNWSFETRQLHIGQEQAISGDRCKSSTYLCFYILRIHNSQHAADRFALRDAGILRKTYKSYRRGIEKRIASLEGGTAALAVASEAAAALAYTFQALAQAGEHIVASKTIYGGTYNYLGSYAAFLK